jgi:hypothetical protein
VESATLSVTTNDRTYSDMMIPELKMSAATTVPCGRGTLLYASIISLLVAWNSNAPPVEPAASRLMTALTLQRARQRCTLEAFRTYRSFVSCCVE